MTEDLKEETKEQSITLTEAQVHALYTRGLINHATWVNVLRGSRGASACHLGRQALRTCEAAIETLVEHAIIAARAVDAPSAVEAASAVIRQKIGVKTGDLAAAALSDGTSAHELFRYTLAALEVLSRGEIPQEDAP